MFLLCCYFIVTIDYTYSLVIIIFEINYLKEFLNFQFLLIKWKVCASSLVAELQIANLVARVQFSARAL